MRTSLPSPAPDRLNILTFGAGAIGTYVGGSLALLGHRVVFLEVEPLVPVIRERGMSLEINGINQVVPDLTVVSTLGECLQIVGGTYDLAVFALKSYDTDSALASIRPYVEQMPPFLCLQNGVENEDKLAEVLGEARIIPASVTSAVGRRAIGSVVLERLRGIAIASNHPRSAFYLDLLNQAGLNARTCDTARSMKWSKMLTNLLGNASSAILGMPPGDIFRNPGLYQLEMGQLREALSVMQALKLKVDRFAWHACTYARIHRKPAARSAVARYSSSIYWLRERRKNALLLPRFTLRSWAKRSRIPERCGCSLR